MLENPDTGIANDEWQKDRTCENFIGKVTGHPPCTLPTIAVTCYNL
jgi:hypothetical protein